MSDTSVGMLAEEEQYVILRGMGPHSAQRGRVLRVAGWDYSRGGGPMWGVGLSVESDSGPDAAKEFSIHLTVSQAKVVIEYMQRAIAEMEGR